jgi:hypothetical protein
VTDHLAVRFTRRSACNSATDLDYHSIKGKEFLGGGEACLSALAEYGRAAPNNVRSVTQASPCAHKFLNFAEVNRSA